MVQNKTFIYKYSFPYTRCIPIMGNNRNFSNNVNNTIYNDYNITRVMTA